MAAHVHGFENLEQAADAIAAYLPHRPRPTNLEGLKKNLRHREGRWFWHWDPAFLEPVEGAEFCASSNSSRQPPTWASRSC